MRWRIGLGEDRGLGGSQVESVRAVASLNVPSPLGTILLILKRKRPFLYGKMAIFSTFRCIFLGPYDRP